MAQKFIEMVGGQFKIDNSEEMASVEGRDKHNSKSNQREGLVERSVTRPPPSSHRTCATNAYGG